MAAPRVYTIGSQFISPRGTVYRILVNRVVGSIYNFHAANHTWLTVRNMRSGRKFRASSYDWDYRTRNRWRYVHVPKGLQLPEGL